MRLWIDTVATRAAQALFGLSPLERLRRGAAKQVGGAGVVLSGGGASANAWPGAQIDAPSDTTPDKASATPSEMSAETSLDNAARPLGERLREALGKAGGAGLVAVDAGNAIDPRLLAFLLRDGPACVAERGEGAHRAVALRLPPEVADAIAPDAPDLRAVADALLAAGRIAPLDERDFPAYVDKLRRSLPYWLYAVPDAGTRRRLERQMFWDNYKGSTDLLTRWVYPPLVWPLVRACVRLRIHPNAVTAVSIVLAFAAVPLFARGDFLAGFACAYGMSVLDSVDGKIARLTLTDSKIGNVLDHGLDQVHPPFWYFAWAWGLGAHSPADPLYQAALWLIGLYVADRIVLGIAKRRLGFALHAATVLDGRVRSVIARRNITMTIMALALLVGSGAAGFFVVTAWQALTFAWHAARTVWLGFLSRGKAAPELR